ncbi:MAG: hypothetical protein ACLFVW_00710 [Phycisphaerae bacterium]
MTPVRKRGTQLYTRRELLRGSLRALAGGGLAVVGATMLLKRTVTGADQSSETCINEQICRDCRAVADCHLPQAMSFRSEGGERG